MTLILRNPKYTIIEKTAAELAGVFYDAGRATGLKSKYKNARAYAKGEFVKFIPKAVEILTGMLGRFDLPDLMKQEIYEAIMERNDDPTLNSIYNLPKTPDGVSVQETVRDLIRNLELQKPNLTEH